MAISVGKSYVIDNDETGEKLSLEVLGNGNIKLKTNCEEIRMETFEEFVSVAKELVQQVGEFVEVLQVCAR